MWLIQKFTEIEPAAEIQFKNCSLQPSTQRSVKSGIICLHRLYDKFIKSILKPDN